MKIIYLFLFLFTTVCIIAQDHTNIKIENDLVNTNSKRTKVTTGGKGELIVNVSLKDVKKIKANGVVRYSDFGAKGDGKIDDIDAIAATHAFANKCGLPVKADDGATYYISGKLRLVEIRTDTDFGKASFIIDDTKAENPRSPVFVVNSNMEAKKITNILTLKRNQGKIDASLSGPSLISVTNSKKKLFIRVGGNQNNGAPQTDIFMVDKDGNVDKNTPIIWDFDQITNITAIPIDEKTLTIRGGRFTTIANSVNINDNTYFNRGIAIRRSNVVVDGLVHLITGEGEHGAPYSGFINISGCAFITVQNTILTGHKVYWKIGNAGVSVPMGTYDIVINRSLNVSVVNCSQTNDINDSQFWGIMSSNYSKNLVYDNCSFSRFDSHMGVANATIRNSTLGHQGISIIGSGTFLIENSTINSKFLINLRPDYGSTWEGDIIIRNCIFAPRGNNLNQVSLVRGSNSGQHNFGYVCYLPERITIENLRIEDINHSASYKGPSIFANNNPNMKDESYTQQFPYIITKEVVLQNVTSASGKELRISESPFIFKDVTVIKK